MPNENLSNSTSRTLRLAMVCEVAFLVVAAFLLFTEHRAHYLGALPYALTIVTVTAFFWLQAERRKRPAKPGSSSRPQRQSGEGS